MFEIGIKAYLDVVSSLTNPVIDSSIEGPLMICIKPNETFNVNLLNLIWEYIPHVLIKIYFC